MEMLILPNHAGQHGDNRADMLLDGQAGQHGDELADMLLDGHAGDEYSGVSTWNRQK